MGYTKREIGARLNISPETVKDRLESTLIKFNITKRTELLRLFANWDFSAWEQA